MLQALPIKYYYIEIVAIDIKPVKTQKNNVLIGF